MEFTPSKLNTFLFFKLPSAYWCGVRVNTIDTNTSTVGVKHKWFNQNPFKSMYFAVQAMAAELSTGILVMFHINKSKRNVSMLVAANKSIFTKKATGKITFTCNDGNLVEEALSNAIATGEGQTFWMKSIGIDEAGDRVSEFEFQWTIKARTK
jgi:hypothetical protein